MPRPIKEYNFNGLDGCVTQRRARQTGTLVGVYHGVQSGMENDPEIPWMTVCEEHHNCVGHSSLRLAFSHVADPQGWCEECREKVEVDDINANLKKTWLASSVEILHFDPPRGENGAPLGLLPGMETKPMKRFVFRDDSVTALDGEVLNNGEIRIIYNGYLKPDSTLAGSYEWGAAFGKFAPGSVVTIESLRRAIANYVVISNKRFAKFDGRQADPIPFPDDLFK